MKRRAFSLTEVLLVSGIMALIMGGATSVSIQTIRGLKYTSNQYDADMSASLALGHLNRALQEANRVTIISPTHIRIFYLQKDSNGVYIQNVVDNVNTLDVYRGGNDLLPSTTGSYLVHAPATGTRRAIGKYVSQLTFSSFTPSSIDVTLRTQYGLTGSVRKCDMIHRAIFLRNY